MIIDRITFTGADDSVSPEELLTRVLTIAENTAMPIELGILLSRNSVGSTRFPSEPWLTRLVRAIRIYEIDNGPLIDNLVHISGHLCGSYAKGFLVGENYCKEDFPQLWAMLARVQINTHAEPVARFDKEAMIMNLSDDDFAKDYIFQMDGVNDIIFEEVLSTTHLRAFPLFDLSHGTGLLPTGGWPFAKYNSPLHGYAGGIGPNNILTVMEQITGVTNDETEIWLDMETNVRSSLGQQFDLNLVTAVMEQLPRLGETGVINEEIE
jgi:hypothetical protein